MGQETYLTNEIEILVEGFFTSHHYLTTPAGELGEVTARSGSATFTAADSREFEIQRTSFWRGWYELRQNGIVIGGAVPEGFWRRTFQLGYRGLEGYVLEPTSVWNRSWRLVDPSGTALLDLEPRGVFKRGARVAVLGEVDLELLAFTYYLVNVRWQEQHAAASAAASGS